MTRPTSKAEPWTTQQELAWLERIGADYIGGQAPTRLDWLRGYLAGAARRVRWDGLDREKILHHAARLATLAALEAGR